MDTVIRPASTTKAIAANFINPEVDAADIDTPVDKEIICDDPPQLHKHVSETAKIAVDANVNHEADVDVNSIFRGTSSTACEQSMKDADSANFSTPFNENVARDLKITGRLWGDGSDNEEEIEIPRDCIAEKLAAYWDNLGNGSGNMSYSSRYLAAKIWLVQIRLLFRRYCQNLKING